LLNFINVSNDAPPINVEHELIIKSLAGSNRPAHIVHTFEYAHYYQTCAIAKETEADEIFASGVTYRIIPN